MLERDKETGLYIDSGEVAKLGIKNVPPPATYSPVNGLFPTWDLAYAHTPEKAKRAYGDLLAYAARLRKVRGVRLKNLLPEELYTLDDFSKEAGRALCRVEEKDVMVCLDLLTGERVHEAHSGRMREPKE